MRHTLAGLPPARLLSVALMLCAWPAMAQPFGPQLQNATITGQGDTITVRRMPVRTPTGIVYRDITIELQVDASGAVRADAQGRGPTPSSPVVAARPTVVIAHDVTVAKVVETTTPPETAAPFTPGLYRDDSHGGTVQLINEGKRFFEAFPTWSISSVAGDTVIGSAEWYAGPLRTNPHQALIHSAGTTSESYSYGVVTSSGAGHFDQGMLIGAAESGRTLTVVSFHRHGCCTYSATPTSQVTYTLVAH